MPPLPTQPAVQSDSKLYSLHKTQHQARPIHLPLDLVDPILDQTFLKDRAYLRETALPIITVSGTYQEDLKGLHDLAESDLSTDIVLSRAHYSMALAVAVAAWGKKIDPKKAWVVDPTNYVSHQEWSKVALTEFVGKILARHPLLKLLKDFVDRFGRSSLPILKSITPPLQYLTDGIHGPILSLHIAAGNILVAAGKQVVQVVTDPHVREDYLTYAERPNLTYCVFDAATKQELLEKATRLGKYVNPKQVIVTGPPVDPRVVAARTGKMPWQPHHRALRLCITTGGLGTNKSEIETILKSLLPQLKNQLPGDAAPSATSEAPTLPIQILVYAGTQWDICDMVVKLATAAGVECPVITEHDPAHFKIQANLQSPAHPHVAALPHLAVIYHPQIVDANELLIHYGFSWADAFVTKPSGDMAYDAAAAGCCLFTLAEWGEWEHNVREVFTHQGIATKAEVNNFPAQLATLAHQGWITTAMQAAQNLGPEFTEGAQAISQAAQLVRK